MNLNALAHNRSSRAACVARQRGLSLMGLIFVLALLGFFGLLAAKSMPAWMEFFAIQRALTKIQTSGETSVPEARKAFDRFAQVDRIEAIKANDIVFTPGKLGVEGKFDYESRVHVVSNVYLVFQFSN